MVLVTPELLERYRRDGYAIVPGVFSGGAMDAALAAMDEALYGRPFEDWQTARDAGEELEAKDGVVHNRVNEEGLPVGVSAGAIMEAAVRVMSRDEMAGKLCVAIVPSFGERYFTHPMFDATQEKARSLVKQPLPAPYDNREFGFATARG